jgi:hypothetical protein
MKIDGSDMEEKFKKIDEWHDRNTSPFKPSPYEHNTSIFVERLQNKAIMELLQNQKRKFEPEEITGLDFWEIRMQIESIFELCQEGEISFHEACDILGNEFIYAQDYKDVLWEKLDDLEGDIIGLDSQEKYTRDAERDRYRKIFDKMDDYYNLVDKFREMLWEIRESKEYQQGRKAKIKSKIIQDGLTLSLVDLFNIDSGQTPKDEYITLPPVFNDVLKEGLLNNTPVNGKYVKMGDKKDMDIIKHIVDHSPYADTLTAELYIQYIHTGNKPQSIGQYISRANTEAK